MNTLISLSFLSHEEKRFEIHVYIIWFYYLVCNYLI